MKTLKIGLVIAFLLSVIMPAFAQKKFTITGDLGSKGKTYVIYLQYHPGKTFVQDSVTTDNGRFTFSGTVSRPYKAVLTIQPVIADTPEQSKTFYLSEGETFISGKDAIIKGGKPQAEFQSFSSITASVRDSLRQIRTKYAKGPVPDYVRTEIDSLNTTLSDETKQWILANRHSYVALDLVGQQAYLIRDPQAFQMQLNALSGELRNTEEGRKYADELALTLKLAIGSPAIDFTQNDTSGMPVSLAAFRGKYVLLDFWASWCGPCRAENPAVLKAYNAYKDKNFTIIGISLDQPGKKTAWLSAIRSDKLEWTQVSDLKFWDNEVVKSYGIRSIPQNLLIDPNGVIIAKNLRGDELKNRLAELLR